MTSIISPAIHLHPEHQNFRSPIILDDAYEFAEAVGLSIAKDSPGGPLANSDIETAWLSMSRYEKSQIPQVKEYDPTRPIQDPVYLAYAQPSFAQPHVNASSSPYTRAISQVPYATSASLQPRTGFNEPAPFSDPTSHQLPEISSYTPQQGPPGTRVFIYFSCTYDIATLPALTYTVMFATRQCGSALTRLSQQGLYHDYVLTADAPPYTATDWSSSEVPLSINVQDGAGSEVGSVDVGPYTYTGYVQQPLSTSAQEGSRKRKVSLESAEATHLPAKRSSTQHLRQEGGEGSFEAPTYAQQRNSVYVQQNQSYAADPSYGNLMPYHRSPNQTYYQPAQRSPRRVSHHLSTSSASSVSQLRGPSPQTPAWSPPNLALTQHSKSPNVSTTAVSRLSSVSSPSNTANPPLIRTSTMQQPPSPGSAPSGPPGTSSFNPYRMYPHKAVLKINGNLETMVDDWSDAELTVKRRLVQFWRSQSSSTITTNFKPVTPEDRQPHSICISCIWWESKQECFITSVDTIFLLESLVAVRFTVEEKNRIRRNLEGFRPLTVSKGKSDSEDFFKLIMGFPAPKPRNIEKDVKVFPWKILTHALKKIISKYSASYASTAGELHNPMSSAYGAGTPSDVGTELLPTPSPRPAPMTMVCNLYNKPLASTVISPRVSHGRLSAPYPSSGPSMLQVSRPSPSHTYTTQSLYAAYQPQSQMVPSSRETQVAPQPHRGSWDFPSFMETNPLAANLGSAPNIYYHHDPTMDPTQETAASPYQMTHPTTGS